MQLAGNQGKPMAIEEQEVMNTLAFEEEEYAVATAQTRATIQKRDEDSTEASTACTLAAQPASL